MEDPFSRARMLLGDEAMERLGQAGVAVFGLGGVGGAAAEALGRAGIGRLALFDPDRVAPTNLNRQTAALHSTIGRLKAEVMRDRLLDIHPGADVTAYPLFYAADNADRVDLSMFSYIVDAIDTVTSKLLLAERAMAVGVPLISCMGTGNKLDPSRLRVADIADTRLPVSCVVSSRNGEFSISRWSIPRSRRRSPCLRSRRTPPAGRRPGACRLSLPPRGCCWPPPWYGI